MSEILIEEDELSLSLPVQVKIDLTLSKPSRADCQIEAKHDIEAVTTWLNQYKESFNTYFAYRRQAKLFLLWCSYECGKNLGQLKVQDFENYFQFLKNPSEVWCANRSQLRCKNWRPLTGPLSGSAIGLSYRVLQSLMNYLNDSRYLNGNPLKLVKMKKGIVNFEEQKYQVWTRMLEDDEWRAVQNVLENLKEETTLQLAYKLRTQFLFGLLYFLGLRIHEVANHTWKAFQFREGKWWFFVKGKGGRLGHVPVHETLLNLAKLYRLSLNKTPLPNSEEEALLVSRNQEPLQIRQLYSIVKQIGLLASHTFKEEPTKALKLKKLSPHWLRHLSASHQDKAGLSATMIKENLRHRSHQTTQLYLHAEETARHEAIQKLSIKIEPKPKAKKMLTSQTLLQVSLTQGPLHKGLGFKKLIEALEAGFTLYQWQPYQFEKMAKAKEIEMSIVPVQNITFAYVFEDLGEDQINALQKAIILEASVRLFKAEIEVRNTIGN